jgi:hypothetical protein
MADGMMLLWFVIILLVGFVAFFVLLIAGVLRVIGFCIRGLFGGWWRSTSRSRMKAPRAPRTCLNRHCGHVNRPDARYCARCGLPLG